MEEKIENLVGNKVQKEYLKAKAEARQPVCPYCNCPLELGQYITMVVYWRWDDDSKTYWKEESDLEPDEPFCMNCDKKDWDFVAVDSLYF